MSIKRMTDVWSDSPYVGSRLLIHLALADFADEDGICYPRKATLATKARCTEETVRTTLLQMAEDGILVILEEPGRGRYARAGRFQLIPKSFGDEGSIPKSDVSIPKSAESTPTRGTVIEPSVLNAPSEQLSDFEDFWACYGRIGAKKVALEGWTKAVKSGAKPDEILAGLQVWVAYWATPGAASMKWPQGWLRERRWEASPPTTMNGGSRSAKTMEVLTRLAQRNA